MNSCRFCKYDFFSAGLTCWPICYTVCIIFYHGLTSMFINVIWCHFSFDAGSDKLAHSSKDEKCHPSSYKHSSEIWHTTFITLFVVPNECLNTPDVFKVQTWKRIVGFKIKKIYIFQSDYSINYCLLTLVANSLL